MTSTPSAVHILYESYEEQTSSYDPEDEWSRPSTHTSHDVTGAELVIDHNKEPFSCLCASPLYPNQEIFVVTAIASTGDSFGHDSGRYIEFLAAFTSLEKAERAVRQVKAHYDINQAMDGYGHASDKFKTILTNMPLLPNPLPLVEKTKKHNHSFIGDGNQGFDMKKFEQHTVEFQNDIDEVEKASAIWVGYFERLDDIRVERLTLLPPKLFRDQKVNIAKPKKI